MAPRKLKPIEERDPYAAAVLDAFDRQEQDDADPGKSACSCGKPDEMPLRCKAVAGEIDMRIGVETLRFAAENHEEFWDGESGTDVPAIKITNSVIFAQEVVLAINEEAEDGSTLLSRMLDEAIKQAVENGCEGVDHDSY